MSVTLVYALVNFLYLRWANRYKARNRDKILAPYLSKNDPEGSAALTWEELGDWHPDFRYTL